MPDDIRPLFAQREVNLHAFQAAAARAFAFGGLPYTTSGLVALKMNEMTLTTEGDVLRYWKLVSQNRTFIPMS